MSEFEKKFVTFDCYRTLTGFEMSALTRDLAVDRVPGERVEDLTGVADENPWLGADTGSGRC